MAINNLNRGKRRVLREYTKMTLITAKDIIGNGPLLIAGQLNVLFVKKGPGEFGSNVEKAAHTDVLCKLCKNLIF